MPPASIFVLFIFLPIHLLNALPAQSTADYLDNRMKTMDASTETTTEAANSTNFLSVVWHTFSNIFLPETTSQTEDEADKHEAMMPEDRTPPSGRSGAEIRMVPMNFSKRGGNEDLRQREVEDEGTADYLDNRMKTMDASTETTTEAANSTNFFSSIWHKISNIFLPETTSQTEDEADKHQVMMPEDRTPPSGRSGAEMRMVPMDFSKRSGKEDLRQREVEDEGSAFSIHQLRMARSDFEDANEENEKDTNFAEVRSKASPSTLAKVKRSANSMVNMRVPVIVEEFDQGQTEGERTKRFKNIQNSTDLRTEKIEEGSDPIETIDKTNYIKELEDDFPFHTIPVKPIIIEDTLPPEISTQKELQPLKIIDF